MSLDASARNALNVLAESGGDPVEMLSPEAAQQNYLSSYSQHQLPLEPVAETAETRVDGIRIRSWRGKDAPETDARAMLYLHGGGWVIGSPETHEDICRSIANRAKAVVVSPDYALAPAAPFPAGLNDCMKVLRHLAAAPGTYGIDCAQIAVAGDSAGGNLAAVLAIMARDNTVPKVAAQILINPVTDCRQTAESYSKKAEGFGLTSAAMAWFRSHYLPHAEDVSDWRASPLLAQTLDGIAPGFVMLAGQDVLFDEGAAYAARLGAETDCITRSWSGQIHGFTSLRGLIPDGDEALDELVEAWDRLAPYCRK